MLTFKQLYQTNTALSLFSSVVQQRKTCPRHIKRAALNTSRFLFLFFFFTRNSLMLRDLCGHWLFCVICSYKNVISSYIKLYSLLLDCQTEGFFLFSVAVKRVLFFFLIFHWLTDKKCMRENSWTDSVCEAYTSQLQFDLILYTEKMLWCVQGHVWTNQVLCVHMCVSICFNDKATDVSVQCVRLCRASQSFFPCHIKWLKGMYAVCITSLCSAGFNQFNCWVR